jgi:maleylacetate reductase
MSTSRPASYVHEWRAQRVLFATGQAPAAVADEVRRAGYCRVMLIAGESESAIAERVSAGLPVVVRTDEVVMHVPVDVAARAQQLAVEHSADAVLCVGGGSATGLAKAVALSTGIPIIAVPTTYAGSEATAVWGLTDGEGKRTGMDGRVLPRVVVYDAELTLTLPPGLSTASGLNALAHCVDSLWAPQANPINRALALEGAKQLAQGLPRVAVQPQDLIGREQVLGGAYLAALSFSSAGSGLHHKICHVLGGQLDLPHAETHAVVLPHVLAFNAPSVPDIDQALVNTWGGSDSVSGLMTWTEALDAPCALRDLGMRREDVVSVADHVVRAAEHLGNPRPVTKSAMVDLLCAAWEGAPNS